MNPIEREAHEAICDLVDRLGDEVLTTIRRMAKLSQCSTLDVIDSLRDQLEAEIEIGELS